MSANATASADSPVMNKKLGFAAMIGSATGMGMVGFFSRGAVPTHVVDGETVKYVLGDFLAFGRMATGAIGFIIIILVTHKLPALRSTKLSFSVIAGGVAIGTSLALYVSATLMTSIANAVFLIYTGPLFSAILAWIFLKERISLRNGLFLLLVFVGMLLIIELITYSPETGLNVGLEFGADPAFPNKTLGDIFGLASGVFYGLALFFYRYRGDMGSEIRGFWNFIFGAIGAVVVLAIRFTTLDNATPAVMDRTNWLWALGLFLVSGLFAIGLLVVAGKHLHAVELSTVSYWETVVALMFGLFFFNESMTATALLGGVLIVVGGMGPVVFELKPKRKGGDHAHGTDAGDETAAVTGVPRDAPASADSYPAGRPPGD